ncbi:MAG: 50S ribosomal protein L32 [Planctomycetota bacterium]|nr:50S ribosomal protein L32 [Planctomycetota bacterium]
MAVPKRRTSKARKGLRRSHHRLDLPSWIKCSRCGAPKALHTICGECGYYRGKPILEIEEV